MKDDISDRNVPTWSEVRSAYFLIDITLLFMGAGVVIGTGKFIPLNPHLGGMCVIAACAFGMHLLTEVDEMWRLARVKAHYYLVSQWRDESHHPRWERYAEPTAAVIVGIGGLVLILGIFGLLPPTACGFTFFGMYLLGIVVAPSPRPAAWRY